MKKVTNFYGKENSIEFIDENNAITDLIRYLVFDYFKSIPTMLFVYNGNGIRNTKRKGNEHTLSKISTTKLRIEEIKKSMDSVTAELNKMKGWAEKHKIMDTPQNIFFLDSYRKAYLVQLRKIKKNLTYLENESFSGAQTPLKIVRMYHWDLMEKHKLNKIKITQVEEFIVDFFKARKTAYYSKKVSYLIIPSNSNQKLNEVMVYSRANPYSMRKHLFVVEDGKWTHKGTLKVK